MELEKIDVVGAKRPQARLERAHQLGPRSPVLDDPGAKLRGEHHLVPPSAQGRPDVLLGASLAVGTGRVEKGDTDIECRAHDLGGLSLVEAPPKVVASEPCERDGESRCAQSPLFHLPSACSPTVRCPAEPSDLTRRLTMWVPPERAADRARNLRAGWSSLERSRNARMRASPRLTGPT